MALTRLHCLLLRGPPDPWQRGTIAGSVDVWPWKCSTLVYIGLLKILQGSGDTGEMEEIDCSTVDFLLVYLLGLRD